MSSNNIPDSLLSGTNNTFYVEFTNSDSVNLMENGTLDVSDLNIISVPETEDVDVCSLPIDDLDATSISFQENVLQNLIQSADLTSEDIDLSESYLPEDTNNFMVDNSSDECSGHNSFMYLDQTSGLHVLVHNIPAENDNTKVNEEESNSPFMVIAPLGSPSHAEKITLPNINEEKITVINLEDHEILNSTLGNHFTRKNSENSCTNEAVKNDTIMIRLKSSDQILQENDLGSQSCNETTAIGDMFLSDNNYYSNINVETLLDNGEDDNTISNLNNDQLFNSDIGLGIKVDNDSENKDMNKGLVENITFSFNADELLFDSENYSKNKTELKMLEDSDSLLDNDFQKIDENFKDVPIKDNIDNPIENNELQKLENCLDESQAKENIEENIIAENYIENCNKNTVKDLNFKDESLECLDSYNNSGKDLNENVDKVADNVLITKKYFNVPLPPIDNNSQDTYDILCKESPEISHTGKRINKKIKEEIIDVEESIKVDCDTIKIESNDDLGDEENIYDIVMTFRCKLCSKVFIEKEALFKHYNDVHKKSGVVRINVDTTEKPDISEVSKKRRKISDSAKPSIEMKEVKKFTCRFCGADFFDRQEHKEHLLQVHTTAVAKENELKKKRVMAVKRPPFSEQFGILVGHRAPNGSRNNRRSKRSIKEPKGLRENYVLSVKANKPLVKNEVQRTLTCPQPFCILKFSTKENLDYHCRCHIETSSAKCYQCFECKAEFDKWAMCQRHLWKAHDIEIELLTCGICSTFKAPSPFILNQHQKIHMGKQYQCKNCDKNFTQLSQLLNHEVVHERKEENKPEWAKKKFCDICNKWFCDQGSLRVHKKDVHLNEKRFSCNECEYQTSRKETLDLHKKKHTGEKPFDCPICDYKTGDRCALRRHLVTHILEIKLHCPLCSFKAYNIDYFKMHINRVHNDQAYVLTCPDCEFSSHILKDFVSHYKVHEKEMVAKMIEERKNMKAEVSFTGMKPKILHTKRNIRKSSRPSNKKITKNEKLITPFPSPPPPSPNLEALNFELNNSSNLKQKSIIIDSESLKGVVEFTDDFAKQIITIQLNEPTSNDIKSHELIHNNSCIDNIFNKNLSLTPGISLDNHEPYSSILQNSNINSNDYIITNLSKNQSFGKECDFTISSNESCLPQVIVSEDGQPIFINIEESCRSNFLNLK